MGGACSTNGGEEECTHRDSFNLLILTFSVTQTEQLGLEEKLETCIRNVLPDWSLLWVSSVPTGKYQDSTKVRLDPFPSKSFPIHCSVVIVAADAM
jgi:hypothetical protein